jgi:hypothetical protein
MHELGQLEQLIKRVVLGGDVSDDEVQAVRFSSDDPVIARAANDAWRLLRTFSDDADIRRRDKEYEGYQCKALAEVLEELAALQRGEDPNGRRLSWSRRWMKRFGFAK